MTPPNVTPDPEVTPTPAPETTPAPVHGHIDIGLDDPLEPGTARIKMSLVGSSENRTSFAVGDRVLIKAFGGIDPSKLRSVDWNLGDGTTKSITSSPFDGGMAVEHIYAAPDVYRVTVAVYAQDGVLTGSASLTVTGEAVEVPPPRRPRWSNPISRPSSRILRSTRQARPRRVS